VIYLLCFAGATALTAFAEKQKRKLPFLLFSALALLLPCLLAAMRHESIGVDVVHYVKPMVQGATEAASFGEFLQYSWLSSIGWLRVADYECGFTIIVYAVARLTKSLPAVLFVIEALIIVPVYIALAQNRQKMPMWLGMLAFFLLFFNGTLNLMRQWMAMALLLLVFQLFARKRYWLIAPLCLLAILMHKSALLIVLIFAIYGILYFFRDVNFSPRIGKQQYTISGAFLSVMLVTALGLLTVLNIPVIVRLMFHLGIDRFQWYISGEKTSFVIKEILLRLPLIVVYLWHWKRLSAHTPLAAFYVTMLLLDAVASQLTSVNPYTYRIALFFSLFTISSLPAVYASLKTPLQKWLTCGICVIYLGLYWWYLHAEMLLHHTYPYHSIFYQ